MWKGGVPSPTWEGSEVWAVSPEKFFFDFTSQNDLFWCIRSAIFYSLFACFRSKVKTGTVGLKNLAVACKGTTRLLQTIV